MIQIVRLKGQDKKLYELVAALVMDPKVLHANNNYPFKTDENFVWFIAVEENKVEGFMPVEQRGNQAIVNNYYIASKRAEVLPALLQAIIDDYGDSEDWRLSSVTLIEDRDEFVQQGFTIDREWTRYIKMSR